MHRLTIIMTLFTCTIVLLLGIIQSYLAHNTLITIDTNLVNFLSTIQNEWILYLFAIITLAADPFIIIAASGIFIIFLVARRRYEYLVGFCVALITSEATTFLSKIFFHRERPNFNLYAITESSFSFPSGHATTAVVFYGFIAYFIIKKFQSLRVRIAAILATIFIVFIVDVSRLYLGVHYFSDVLAGNLVGLAGLLIAIVIVEQRIARTMH